MTPRIRRAHPFRREDLQENRFRLQRAFRPATTAEAQEHRFTRYRLLCSCTVLSNNLGTFQK